MNPLDAVWLMMESDDTPMHVGVLCIFRIPRSAPRGYVSRLGVQLRRSRKAVAPWNLRLPGGVGDVFAPRLIEDEAFDLDYHFRHSALAAPGGERELGVMVSRLHSIALDRSRPLWEFHLIEGLAQDRFAFYVKVHHALVDNVNGIAMMVSALSAGAAQRNTPPLWSRPLRPGEGKGSGGGERGTAWSELPNPGDFASSLRKAAAGFVRNALGRGKKGSFLMPLGTPRSTLNRQINCQRRFATQQIERARIERLAEATDSTLNEILTYLCGSTLRRFFKEYNALPDESLIGAMPISLNERSESVPGNAIAGLRVALATHIGDPMARLEAVKASMQAVRKDRASLPKDAVTPYVMMRAVPIYASQAPVLGRLVPPLFNLTVSNTPGPKKPLYFNGARLEAIYPMSPLMQFSALSIDCVGYAGTLNIGFTGARDTLPHLQRMAVYFGSAVDEIEELVQSGETAA